MADRYWVGGAGTWDATTTTNWATTSGGAGGASAPTFEDNVIFDSASNATAYTVTISTNAVCEDFTAAGPLVGNVTFFMSAATSALNIFGSMTLPASNFTWSAPSGGSLSFKATTTGKTITTNGSLIPTTSVFFNGAGGEWTLGSAFTGAGTVINFTQGTFNTNNYNVTAGVFVLASNSLVRSVNLGSSNITLSGTSVFTVGAIQTNLTFDAGTSSISISSASPIFGGGGLTYYNVSFTSAAIGTVTITGANTFNDLTYAARAAAGTGFASIGADQTINGTLTLGSGTTGVARLSVQSSVVGTARTLTVATLAAPTDIDFRDIVAAGASSPWSGTRLGNCLGNNNITFDAGKTVYWNLAAGGNYNGAAWATTSGGSAATTNYPLAQDTAIIEDTGLNTSATINLVSYNTGTIDISTRSNAMTFNNGSNNPRIYGNVIFSSALTNTATTGGLIFNGQGLTQQLTTAGVNLAAAIVTDNATGTVQLLDNLATSGTVTLTSGTLDLNDFDLTCNIFSSNNSNTRAIAFGTGQIDVTGNNGTVFAMSAMSNFTYTGTSKINLTYSGGVGTRTIATGLISSGATETNALNFNVTAGTDIISMGQVFKNLDLTGFSGGWQTPTSTRTMYGNLTFSSGITLFSGTVGFQFLATSGTQEITTAGQTLDFPIVQDGVGGTVQLQDNLTMGSTRAFTLTEGTLDLNDKVLTAGSVSTSNSNTRSIDFGRNGVINCEGEFTATTATGLTTAGRGRIKMSSASAKTFAGGGANYSAAALEQAGAGTLTITGANTFDDITNSNATASQITFPANTTTSVRKLSVSGSPGNLVSLRSSTDGTKFTIQTV
jgi:hypothetical protein